MQSEAIQKKTCIRLLINRQERGVSSNNVLTFIYKESKRELKAENRKLVMSMIKIATR